MTARQPAKNTGMLTAKTAITSLIRRAAAGISAKSSSPRAPAAATNRSLKTPCADITRSFKAVTRGNVARVTAHGMGPFGLSFDPP
jgi:hypothetical protein